MTTATHPYRQALGIASQEHLTGNPHTLNSDPIIYPRSEEPTFQQKSLVNPDTSFDGDFQELTQPIMVSSYQRSVSSPLMTSPTTPTTPTSSNLEPPRLRNHSRNLSVNTFNSPSAQRRSRSVDLSHMYLLNNKDTQFTSTNESVADLSHQMITQYLGEAGSSSLVPRLKTIEMYKQNVKKSKDPNILFQYAQYMLQTALTIETSTAITSESNGDSTSLITPTVKDGGKGVPTQADLKKQFLREAQHYLKKLSVKRYTDAQYLLADAYSSGAFGKVNAKDAFALFQSAAKHGHIESAYRTAHCFEEGLGTTRDSRRAVEFLKFAASRNHPSAMYKLGMYSYYGRMGLPNDVNTKQNGIKWLSRAVARANELTCAAPYELAKIYQDGFLDIIIPDEKYAMELYVQAASLGHAPSATVLGQIYETGNQVVPQDTSLSVHYYTQAALQADPEAMLGLCAWYLVGAEPAFEKDEREAFQWALRAAKLGLPRAQFTVGYFYEKGKGCETNMDNAWKWYGRAARNKDARAIAKVKQNPNIQTHKTSRKSKSLSTLNMRFSTVLTFNSESSNDSPSSQPAPDNSSAPLVLPKSVQQNGSGSSIKHSKSLLNFDQPASVQPVDVSDFTDKSFRNDGPKNISNPNPPKLRTTKSLSMLTSKKTKNNTKNTKNNTKNKRSKDCVIM